MIGTLTGMLALMASMATDPTSACSLLSISTQRPRNVVELSLRATPDSVRDHRAFAATADHTGYRARLPWDTAAVYGQVFRVVRVGGDANGTRLQHHAEVIVVWWRLGVQCQRVTPWRAIRPDVRDLFIVARPLMPELGESADVPIVADLRPASEWIGGAPTLDVTEGSWLYAPGERRPVNLPAAMTRGVLTVPEYREFFALLPVYGAPDEQHADSWRRLLRWADADPRRWSLYPASVALCVGQVNTGVRTASQPCTP